MKVVICWADISGYMAACWRALVESRECELFVIARCAGAAGAQTAFDTSLMAGIPCELFPTDRPLDQERVLGLVAQHKPDVVVINGWHTPAYRAIAGSPQAAGAKIVMAMDTPFLGTMRQRLGRVRMGPYFSKVDRVFVAGERCWQLARVLGFPESIIRRGVYAANVRIMADVYERRLALPGGWPKKFLFTGRYVPEKGIDVLLHAYAGYRQRVADPWPLTMCGKGPLGTLIQGAAGVEDRGFVQPGNLPGVMLEHGAFVLPSRYEPWGVVIAEAGAAGLPVLCSEACGASVELVRGSYNGYTFATGSAPALLDALLWAHHRHHLLPEMGRASRDLASAFSAEMWVRRWVTTFHELVPGSARVA